MMHSDFRKLMINAANLSLRRETNCPEEIGSIHAALWRIFSDEWGRKCLKEILNRQERGYWGPPLSDEQINAFKALINPFRDTALNHGLLSNYDDTVESIDFIKHESLVEQILCYIEKIVNLTLQICFGYLVITNLNGLIIILLAICWFLHSAMDEKTRTLASLKKQNDYIIRKTNDALIKRESSDYQARLVVLGWLESDLPAGFTQDLLENSKKYQKFWFRNFFGINRIKIDIKEDSKRIADIWNRASQIIQSGKFSLAMLLNILENIDHIIDSPFASELEIQQRDKIREFWINKLRHSLLIGDTEYVATLAKAEAINGVSRNVLFDNDRISAYRIFFETENYGCFIGQLSQLSRSDQCISKLAKFTPLSILEIESLSNLIEDQTIFKEISHRLISKALRALSSNRMEITDKNKNYYFAARFDSTVKTVEGRRQIINDLMTLHQALILYMKLMLNIMAVDTEDPYGLQEKQCFANRELKAQIMHLLKELSLYTEPICEG